MELVTRRVEGAQAIAGPLLAELARAADPDAALRHAVDLIGKRGERATVAKLRKQVTSLGR